MHDYAEVPKSLGERIKEARGDLTQQAFGVLLGVDQASVSRYERDEVTPGLGVALVLVREYGFEFDDFEQQVA